MKLLITWVLHATALLALAHLSTGIEISSFATAMAAALLDGFKVSGFASALLGSLLYSTFCMLIDSALQHLFPPQPL
jgi:putative membrane protein